MASTGTTPGFNRRAQRFPMLEAAEEYALARRWRDHGDEAARDRLVESHLRLVIRMAARFRGYGRPVEDFVSAGMMGLMDAVARFDPDRGARLSTYASWWIRSAIQAEAMRSWSMVRIGTTAAEKKLFFGLRRTKQRAGVPPLELLGADDAERLGRLMGVGASVVEDMDRRLAKGDQSLNVTLDPETGTEWQDTLADPGVGPESNVAEREQWTLRRSLLRRGLGRLTGRERRIVEARRLSDEPLTLRVLAEEMGVSCERVRQIEARALEKLGRAVRGAADGYGGDGPLLNDAA